MLHMLPVSPLLLILTIFSRTSCPLLSLKMLFFYYYFDIKRMWYLRFHPVYNKLLFSFENAKNFLPCIFLVDSQKQLHQKKVFLAKVLLIFQVKLVACLAQINVR